MFNKNLKKKNNIKPCNIDTKLLKSDQYLFHFFVNFFSVSENKPFDVDGI